MLPIKIELDLCILRLIKLFGNFDLIKTNEGLNNLSITNSNTSYHKAMYTGLDEQVGN